jgi:hypothetical protein
MTVAGRERVVKKITKTAQQILTALGQWSNATRLLNAWLDEEGAHFEIEQGTITPTREQILGFLEAPDGTLVQMEFDGDAQTVEFGVN